MSFIITVEHKHVRAFATVAELHGVPIRLVGQGEAKQLIEVTTSPHIAFVSGVGFSKYIQE